VTVVDNGHGTVAIKEIGMPGVDIACFHCDKVSNKLVGGVHNFLKEIYHNLVEFLFELWISPEQVLLEKLAENTHEFVENKGDTFQ